MASVDMCEHGWPGSGCKDCRIERLEAEAKRLKETLEESKAYAQGWDAAYYLAFNQAVRACLSQVTLGDTYTRIHSRISGLLMRKEPHTPSADTQLKPCPFCGGTASTFVYRGCDCCRSDINAGVECTRCRGKMDHHNSEEEAIHAWNSRAPAQREHKLLPTILPNEAMANVPPYPHKGGRLK